MGRRRTSIIWAVILAALFSLLVGFNVLDTRNRAVWTIGDFFYRVTEPALRPIRNLLPNLGGVDLSPLVLLLGVALFGDIRNGARRWLSLGFTSIQPSELMKIAMPLMLAWYFHKREAVLRWYDYLVSKGVECVSRPERSPRGHSFFFAKDIDGNLIELMDLGHMYYVLGWLGPLGGWLFRRGMYKQYYT